MPIYINYNYDIYLNFNKEYFDFYEWNDNDNIDLITKIPIFLVKENIFKDILKYEVIFDKEFTLKIKNKTKCNNKYITAFIVTDGNNILSIKIDSELKYSSIQIEDELDILSNINYDYYDLKYKIINKKTSNLKTRKEKEIINSLLKEKDISKLRYIYYECFNKKENNIKIIKSKLKQLTNSDFLKITDIFDTFKLTFN